jgi:hypothetical protein
MKMSATTGAMAAAVLLAGGGTIALSQDLDPETTLAPPLIEVSVDCLSSPERVTVTNNRAKPITIKSVSSIHARRASEPYKVKKTLIPGKSFNSTFGTGKGKGKRLTGSFIFDNDSPREAVLVKTNRGNVKVKCSEGTNARPEAVVVAPGEIALPIRPGEPLDALDLLATLPVEPEVDEGYERALFEHWVDADGDGCDARQEVLIAESLTPVALGSGCSIEGGSWYSAADGDTLTNPASVDINHVVPLKEAWASGAHAWTPERREAFANDLSDERTLQAVSSGANRQQGESDPASWLPADQEAACQFVRDWVEIKATWGLTVDEIERSAIEATLVACVAALPNTDG